MKRQMEEEIARTMSMHSILIVPAHGTAGGHVCLGKLLATFGLPYGPLTVASQGKAFE